MRVLYCNPSFWEYRLPFYAELSTEKLDVSALTPGEAARAIVEKYP